MFNEKDAVRLNKLFDKGLVRNKGSLSFAVSSIKNKSSLEQLAYLVRAIVLDHVFEDGNKRTAAVLIAAYFTEFEIGFDQDKVNKLVLDIASKNLKDIAQIRRMIKNAIR
ncbi:Fic family protein [Candidatus Woesearchaeota archaeon]|nr:Fic family protein [Candidatus Woesearchaeota archaeon]